MHFATYIGNSYSTAVKIQTDNNVEVQICMKKHESYTWESKLVEAESGEGDKGRGRQRAQQPAGSHQSAQIGN
jgi:ribosomal protein L31